MSNKKKLNSSQGYIPVKIVDVWKKAIVSFCKTKGPKNVNDIKGFTGYLNQSLDDITQLWQLFSQDRKAIKSYLKNSDRQCAAYLLGFHLPNVARSAMVLNRVPQINISEKKIRIIDLGCGTGALSLALMHRLNLESKDLDIEVHLVDKQKKMVLCAEKMIKLFNPNVKCVNWFIDVTEFQKKFRFDEQPKTNFILLGNVINEMQINRKHMSWFDSLQNLNNSTNHILVVEPAKEDLANGARDFSFELRANGWNIAYPCQNSEKCPMLVSKKDWCFSETEWHPPKEQQKIEKILHGNRKKLNSAGFWISSSPIDSEPKKVIVGRPTIRKGSQESQYLLCDGKTLSKKPMTNPPLLRGQHMPLK